MTCVCCCQGFEWYDTHTSTMISNVTFDNYRYRSYSSDPSDWWFWQTPHAIRMLSHSDQFKPGRGVGQEQGWKELCMGREKEQGRGEAGVRLAAKKYRERREEGIKRGSKGALMWGLELAFRARVYGLGSP